MEEIDSSNNIIAQVPSTREALDETNSIDLKIEYDEEVSISKKKKIKDKPYFLMVGSGRRNNKLDKGVDVMDFIKEMTHMTPQELFVIEQMKDYLITDTYKAVSKKTGNAYDAEYLTNIALVKMSVLPNADQQKFKKGYKRLSEKKIVGRVKRSHYIFNPSFIIPRFYDDTLKQWNASINEEA